MSNPVRGMHVVTLVTTGLLAAALHAQVAVGTISGRTCRGPILGYVAYIDISNDRFTPHVTPRDSDPICTSGVAIRKTIDFMYDTGSIVAITANAGAANPPQHCAVPDGLLMHDGDVVNPIQANGPSMYFTDNHRATIAKLTTMPAGVENAVAGTTKQDNDCLGDPQMPGGLLVQNGRPGPCIVPKSLQLAPRTAAGVNGAGTILILVTIGGIEGQSGLITFDMANLMIGLGAVNAVNFDGGGSSAFYWIPSLIDSQNPPESPGLVNMLEAARFPSGLPNPDDLQFQVTKSDISQPLCYCALDQETDCQHGPASGCREVYASLGFTYMEQPKK